MDLMGDDEALFNDELGMDQGPQLRQFQRQVCSHYRTILIAVVLPGLLLLLRLRHVVCASLEPHKQVCVRRRNARIAGAAGAGVHYM